MLNIKLEEIESIKEAVAPKCKVWERTNKDYIIESINLEAEEVSVAAFLCADMAGKSFHGENSAAIWKLNNFSFSANTEGSFRLTIYWKKEDRIEK